MSTPPDDHRVHGEQEADDEDVPAQEVELREGDVLGAEHQRQHEVAENRGHGGDQHEEHHRHAVHGEQLVVGVRRARGRPPASPARGGSPSAKRPPRKKAKVDDHEVHDADALVVLGQQPRRDRVLVVQIGHARRSHVIVVSMVLPVLLRRRRRRGSAAASALDTAALGRAATSRTRSGPSRPLR